jgi:hypothetical protein
MMTPLTEITRPRVAPNSKPQAKKYQGNGKQRQARVLPKLNVDSDSDASKAWRSGRRHDAEHDFPSGYNPGDDTGAFQCLIFIQAITGTHFQLYKRTPGADSNMWAVKIWGTSPQILAAKSELATLLIDSNAGANRYRKFGKVTRNRGWEYEEAMHKKLQREVKRQKYRKNLSGREIREKKFACSIIVPWSEKDLRVEDFLGHQLEAIDEIRMDGQCYVTFERNKNESVFVLLGDDHDKMAKAAARIQAIPARMFSHSLEPAQLFLLKPVSLPFDYSAFKVRQLDHYHPAYAVPTQKSSANEEIAGKTLALRSSCIREGDFLDDGFAETSSIDDIEDHGAVWFGNKHTAPINQQYLHLWVTTALKHLTFYKGFVRMEINIGTCVLQRYKRGGDGDGTYGPGVMEDFLLEANNGITELDAFIAAE